jgi:predicted nuclease of predicted toxin-antitoxin system
VPGSELRRDGHDAVHVLELGMQGASDDQVLARAVQEDRVVVTVDTDFGTLPALSGADRPSVLLLRGVGDSHAERRTAILGAIARVSNSSTRALWSWSSPIECAFAPSRSKAHDRPVRPTCPAIGRVTSVRSWCERGRTWSSDLAGRLWRPRSARPLAARGSPGAIPPGEVPRTPWPHRLGGCDRSHRTP